MSPTYIAAREKLHQIIDTLPDTLLEEVAQLIENAQVKPTQPYVLKETRAEYHVDEPEFIPVHFPEGILKGVDFTPEYIAQARKELWAGFGESVE